MTNALAKNQPGHFIRAFNTEVPPAARQKILTALGNSNALQTALKAARVNPSKVYNYFKWAKQTLEDPYYSPDDYSSIEVEILDFYQAVEAAQAIAEQNMLTNVTAAAHDDWRAAQFVLARRNKEEWGEIKPGTQVNIQNNGAATPGSAASNSDNVVQGLMGNAKIDLSRLTTDELIQLEKLLAKASTPTDVVDNDFARPAARPASSPVEARNKAQSLNAKQLPNYPGDPDTRVVTAEELAALRLRNE